MKNRLLLILATALVVSLPLTGCGGQGNTKPSANELQAFAPGMDNLSPEAKALKEKNEQIMRDRQKGQAGTPR